MSTTTVVYEDSGWTRLLPLTWSRPVFRLLCGFDDLLSKTAALLPEPADAVAAWCRDALRDVQREESPHPVNQPIGGETLLLNGRGWWTQLPDTSGRDTAWVGLCGDSRIACVYADEPLAARLSPEVMLDENQLCGLIAELPQRDVSDCVRLMDWPWDVVDANENAILADWGRYRDGVSNQLDRDRPGVFITGREHVSIGQDSNIKPCVVIDAENGPVWIGENVTIQPHSFIEGPAFIGDRTLLQPGAVVHAGTSIGPRSKVGGEIEASIIHGYSNKQHNGFLGHSYIGSWVNIAADCINSDLKNTYGTVRVPINGTEVDSGCQFVGMYMGDHSKAGINVSFPTGSVIGFGCNVMTSQSPKYVPSFTWIEGDESCDYEVDRAIQVARRVVGRRQCELTAAQERLFFQIREMSERLSVSGEGGLTSGSAGAA